MTDPLAASYTRWLTQSGKSITLKTRSEGSPDSYHDPAITYTDSTIKAFVYPLKANDVLATEGYMLYDYRRIHVSVDTVVNALDRVVIDTVTYELDGPPVKRTSYQEFQVRRLIQA